MGLYRFLRFSSLSYETEASQTFSPAKHEDQVFPTRQKGKRPEPRPGTAWFCGNLALFFSEKTPPPKVI